MIKLKDILYELKENDSTDSGGVLYYHGDKVLLCLGSNSGVWNVPKGHIMVKEKPMEGSVREFTEETQIQLDEVPKLANTFEKDNGGTFYLYVLKSEKKSIPQLDHEHTDWGYFDANDLPNPINDWVKETIEKQCD
jgi:8-oxo-dGTP pyrophosphatase MutT (NUDIX family)